MRRCNPHKGRRGGREGGNILIEKTKLIWARKGCKSKNLKGGTGGWCWCEPLFLNVTTFPCPSRVPLTNDTPASYALGERGLRKKLYLNLSLYN